MILDDQIMTKAQVVCLFREGIEQFGSLLQLALALGYNRNTLYRYRNGDNKLIGSRYKEIKSMIESKKKGSLKWD